MANSLRDQLLKAGLADEQRVKQVETEKRRDRKRQKPRKGQAQQKPDAAKRAEREAAEKRERDRRLNQARDQDRQRIANEKAARELVVKNEIPHGEEGDQPFNFTHGERIKKIHVSEKQRRELAEGRIAIARTRGRFRLVPRAVADKVMPMAPFLIAFVSDGKPDPAEEEHPIPDDLMW